VTPLESPAWELDLDLAPSDAIAGVDEVGRGALFGPVVAAAIVVPYSALPELVALAVADSKTLAPDRRRELAAALKARFPWRIGYATVREIDQLNILQASLLAMERALAKLPTVPTLCQVDGRFPIPALNIPQQVLVKGDCRSPAIAAASILAKVWRDDAIVRWDAKYPGYHLASNKGYGTPPHRRALQAFGPSPQHRRSFRPCQVEGASASDRATPRAPLTSE